MGEWFHNLIQPPSRGMECPGLKCAVGNISNTFQEQKDKLLEKPLVTGFAQLVGFTGDNLDEYFCLEGNPSEPVSSGLLETVTDVDKKKGGGHMNMISFDKKIHMKRLHALRRGAAAVLALTMLCPMLPFASHAAAAVAPVQMATNVDSAGQPDGSGEAPTLTIEVNGVIDQANHLTGFVEVAIRAKPALLHLDAAGAVVPSVDAPGYDHSEIQPFGSMGVALEYSEKLIPWEWEKINGSWEKLDPSLDPANTAQAIDLTDSMGQGFSSAGMTEVEPLHKKTRIAHAAVSAKEDADGNADGVDFNDGGYLYLMAGGFDSKDFALAVDPVTGLPQAEDTVLAVVRFKYELDENDETQNPWSTMFPKGKNNPNVTDWIDPRNPEGWLVRIADEAIVDAPDDPIIDWEVTYDSGKSQARPNGNGMYYSTDTSDGREAYDPTLPDSDPNYASTLTNCMEVALVDTTAPTPSTTDIVLGKINYTLVNRLSYNFSGGDPDDYATILFYDWDDTLIGTLVVDKDMDSRERVNNYVRDNFIYTDGNNDPAGDDTNLSLQDNTPDAVSSLERMENYRGKYDHTGPGPDVTTPVVADGGSYPLTNKLDYVFFKRPMVNNEADKPDETDTVKYPGGATDPDYLEDLETWRVTSYIQASEPDPGDATGTATLPVWDTEYPYIHGWALVEDFAHPEEVWTTLGMIGELSDYTDYRTGVGAPAIPQTTPAELTVSSGGSLVFADFDFSNQPVESTYAVKAIYEPGVDLLNTEYRYRMIKEPYFNKLNSNAATSTDVTTGLLSSAGGSYSAQMTFERASLDLAGTNIMGVARMRSPAVRQDTTADLRWETNTTLGIDHNLPNADSEDAYGGKKQVTYTKIPVNNVDEITFIITLSARQNKVDYYLREEYGYNFVVGADRTISDRDRSEGENIPDNYNYLTDESDTTDAYYDAKYLEREGSHGFVLYGTLNNLLEKATSANHGGTDFNEYVTNETMADANLRHPTTKETALNNNPGQRDAMRNAIKEAAKQAEAHVGQPDEALYWNADHGHAQLTYHQLQWFISDTITAGSATLLSPAAAQARQIGWCHLDASCAAASSGKPTSWEELLQAADAGESDKLKLLSAGEIESYFVLRDAGGAVWNGTVGVADFATRMIDAVAAIKGLGISLADITWDQVQYYLDQGTVGTSAADMDSYGSQHFWWYDKATDGTIDNWAKLDTAVKAAISSAIVLPDGRTVGSRQAKLNQLESTFNANGAPTVTNATNAWISATHNLSAQDANNIPGASVGVKFGDWTTFVNEVTDAWTAAAGMAVESPTWEQVQYHVFHKNDGGYSFPIDPAGIKTETDTYWWKDGGQKISTVETLLAAADKANNGDGAALDSLLLADLDTYEGLQFRIGFNGTTDKVTDLDAFKTQVKAIVAQHGTNMSWDQLQYLLIHGVNSVNITNPMDNIKIADEAGVYYWWKNKGDGSSAPYCPAITVTDVNTLMEAAYRSKENGNPHAWDNLSSASQLADPNGGTSGSFRLVDGNPAGTINFADLTMYTDGDLSGVIGELEALYDAVVLQGTEQYNNLTWYQVQHYLLTGTYLERTDPALPGSVVYWWKDNESDPSMVTADPDADFGKMISKLTDYYNDMSMGGGMTINDVLNGITVNMWNNMGFVAWDAENWMSLPIDDSTIGMVVSNWVDAESGGSIGYGTYIDWSVDPPVVDLTWYQIQDIIINGSTYFTVNDPWTAMANVQGLGITQPAWADAYWPDGASKVQPLPMSLMAEDLPTLFAVMNRAPLKGSKPVVSTETSADGLTQTTTETKKVYNRETGIYDTVTTVTVVTRAPAEGVTVVITTVTTTIVGIDPETGDVKIDTSSNTVTAIEQAPAGGQDGATYVIEGDAQLLDPDNVEDDSVIPPEETAAPEDASDPVVPSEEPEDKDASFDETGPESPDDLPQSSEDVSKGDDAPEEAADPTGPLEEQGDGEPASGETGSGSAPPDDPAQGPEAPTEEGGVPEDVADPVGPEEGDSHNVPSFGETDGSALDTGSVPSAGTIIDDNPEKAGDDAVTTDFEEGVIRVTRLLSMPALTPARFSSVGVSAPAVGEAPKLMDLREPLALRKWSLEAREESRFITRLRGLGRDGPLPLYMLRVRERIRTLHFTGLAANGRI